MQERRLRAAITDARMSLQWDTRKVKRAQGLLSNMPANAAASKRQTLVKNAAQSSVSFDAYDLSNITAEYTAEYGGPPELAEFAEGDAFTWLVATAALPLCVRRVHDSASPADNRLVLCYVEDSRTDVMSFASRFVRNCSVAILLEYVPSVRHMLGLLKGSSRHNLGAAPIPAVDMAQVCKFCVDTGRLYTTEQMIVESWVKKSVSKVALEALFEPLLIDVTSSLR